MEQGGSYHKDEVDQYRQEAHSLDEEVRLALSSHCNAVEQLRSRIEAAQDASAFLKEVQARHEDLAVSQGLGSKFGGPKMKASVALRELFAKSDQQQARIDALIDSLTSITKAPPVTNPPPQEVFPVPSVFPFFLPSLSSLTCLVVSRMDWIGPERDDVLQDSVDAGAAA